MEKYRLKVLSKVSRIALWAGYFLFFFTFSNKLWSSYNTVSLASYIITVLALVTIQKVFNMAAERLRLFELMKLTFDFKETGA